MNHILEVDSVQLQINGRNILSDIYLKCQTGRITGLLGRNGEGKSCLMNVIFGALKCERSVRIDRVAHNNALMSRNQIFYLPQFNFIPKSLSPRRIFRDFELDLAPFLEKFPEFIRHIPHSINHLSGGECRLLEFYIILKSKSKFVLLDEPFTHLNPLQIEKAVQLILEQKTIKGILISDHMFRQVITIADDLYLLKEGKTFSVKELSEIETLGYARL